MSYQVLARKWRPRDFGSLVGQEHVVRALRHALQTQRLHHAYLFTGTRGVGKTTLARILAKCLNCEAGVTAQPCGRCTSCVEIDGGRFVDLLEVDAATNTRVDEMRQLLETAQYAPTRGRYKVYVIDEVHMLSTSAFNAMLKTLEEPPEHLKFILATTDPQKIPVTVLSRCLQFGLKQMPRGAIAEHLQHLLGQENVPFEAEALAMIGQAAAGSMRDALSLLDQAIAHGGGRISADGVRDMLGTIDQSYLIRLLDSVSTEDARSALDITNELQSRSVSFDTALADLAGLLLRIAISQLVPDGLDEDTLERQAIQRLAGTLHPETVQLYYQIALQGREDLPRAPDEHAGFLMTLLRMIAFRPDAGAPAARMPDRGESFAEPARPSRSAFRDVSRPRALGRGDAEHAPWPELVTQLPVSGAARELARHAELRRRDGAHFDLVVPRSRAYLADRSYQDKLQAALAQQLGVNVQLKVAVGEVSGATAANMESSEREARQAEAARAVREDRFVKDLVNLFDATVVDSTIRVSRKDGP